MGSGMSAVEGSRARERQKFSHTLQVLQVAFDLDLETPKVTVPDSTEIKLETRPFGGGTTLQPPVMGNWEINAS